MIKQIERKDAYFVMPELDYPYNLYFKGLLHGMPYAVCHAQYSPEHNIAYLHLVVHEWNKAVMKELHRDYIEIEELLRNSGIKNILVSHSIEDGKIWTKFINRLGFPEPEIQEINNTKCLISVKEV